MWIVIGKLNCPKISLVSRLIEKTSDFCIISITNVTTVYSPTINLSKPTSYVMYQPV